LTVEGNFIFEEKVKKDTDCIVVAVDFETVAGVVDFGSSVPS
jgi:hypothetical protein